MKYFVICIRIIMYIEINIVFILHSSWPIQIGSKAICSTSIPKSFCPLLTKKSPFIPQFGP